jgi:hypothetical protein
MRLCRVVPGSLPIGRIMTSGSATAAFVALKTARDARSGWTAGSRPGGRAAARVCLDGIPRRERARRRHASSGAAGSAMVPVDAEFGCAPTP